MTVCLRRAGEILPDKPIEEYNDDKFGQLMRSKAVHLLALFVMVYIGVEVTIGGIVFVLHDCHKSNYCKSGWIVTFLMIVREGASGPSSGYVSTGPRVELFFFH
jgi:fucose permease